MDSANDCVTRHIFVKNRIVIVNISQKRINITSKYHTLTLKQTDDKLVTWTTGCTKKEET